MTVTVFFDFDGVFNHFTSRSAYQKHPDTFGYVKRASVFVPRDALVGGWGSYGGSGNWYDLNWSGELVKKFNDLRATKDFNWLWLTTWVGNTGLIDRHLGFDDTDVVSWDPHAFPKGASDWKVQDYRDRTKLSKVLAWIADNPGKPFAWFDDTATRFWDDSFAPESTPRYVCKPDENLGILRTDFDGFVKFMEDN